MRERELKHGLPAAPELGEPVQITIETSCPDKWLMVDLETGDVWVHCPRRRFRRADHVTVSVTPVAGKS